MKATLLDAISRSRAGYSELRLQRVWSSQVLVRDREVESAGTTVEIGGLARCCSPDTGWGAVGFNGLDRLSERLLLAHELALAAESRSPVQLAPIPIREVEQAGPLARDPRTLGLLDKRERATAVADALFSADRRVTGGRALLRDQVVETWLATSEGTWVHELRSAVSAAVLVVAEEGGTTERALGSRAGRAGWDSIDFAGLAQEAAVAAVEQVHAKPVRPGRYPLVLNPAAAGALIHRAVAHLARPALPGVDPAVLPRGTRVGPECLTVGDDPAAEGLQGSSVADDEGTAGRRTVLVQNGVVLGHLHTRETAAADQQAPTGHARAGSLQGSPHPRCTNSYLAPGKGTLDELLSGVGEGVYLSDLLTCLGVDDQFSLRAGRARMIRKGHLAEPVKGVQLDAELLALLGRVDGVAADFTWNQSSERCRDGAAGVVSISTGAPHLRLVDVPVGLGRP